MKQLAWSILKPLIIPWLKTRALAIPVAKKMDIAKKLGVQLEMVNVVNEAIIEQAMIALDTFKP